jgi:hypothetical protein
MLKGRETVDVEFFDGSAADAFLRAVEANVMHGFPLSLADRRAAAARIIASHPQMSDWAIATSTGLAARTVAAIRQSATDAVPQLNGRVGIARRVAAADALPYAPPRHGHAAGRPGTGQRARTAAPGRPVSGAGETALDRAAGPGRECTREITLSPDCSARSRR